MMRSFRPTTLQYFVKLMLPAIVPTIFTSWKVNISLAIRVVTIAELVGAVTGIGHQLSVAQELFSVADVFAWTIVLVALLFLLEAIVSRFEARLSAVARMSGPPPINVAGLRKVFRQTTTGQSVIAIERLDLTIAPREVVAIVGQTGCGKSTFFDLMIGLEAPTEGAIRIGDKTPARRLRSISAVASPPCSSRTGCCRGARRSTTPSCRLN